MEPNRWIPTFLADLVVCVLVGAGLALVVSGVVFVARLAFG